MTGTEAVLITSEVEISDNVSVKLTQFSTPIAGSNFGKVILDVGALVVSSEKVYLSTLGATPFSQRHWASDTAGLSMPPRRAVKDKVESRFLFIGTEFGYDCIVMVGLRIG